MPCSAALLTAKEKSKLPYGRAISHRLLYDLLHVSPSSPAVLPTAALLTLSLPIFAGKKYRPESCFSSGSAKAGLRHRRNKQKQAVSVGYFQQAKDGGRFFRPPSSRDEQNSDLLLSPYNKQQCHSACFNSIYCVSTLRNSRFAQPYHPVIGRFALWAGAAAREKHPCVRYRYEKGCRLAAFFIGTIIYRRPAAAPPAAHSAGEHPDKLSGCRRNPLPACCRCGCCDPSPSPR